MNGMEPLAEEHGANGGSGGAPKLSLEILSHLKRAQMQNGLRHEDYQRYRQYCARRLARIRRNRDVKFSHAGPRGRFENRKVNPEDCTNELFLYIPLMNAERAWAYAMQLRKDNELIGNESRAKYRHMIRRLSKASQWAESLKDLCNVVANDRTILHAQAYSAYMKGTYLLEKDSLAGALTSFDQARSIYAQLLKVSSEEQQGPMKERLDEIELMVMYCTRYLSKEGINTEDLLLKSATGGSDLIRSKMNTVTEAMKEKAHKGVDITFLGRPVPVRSEKIGLHLLAAQENARTLDVLIGELLSNNENLHIGDEEYENIDTKFIDTFAKYDDALREVRNQQDKLNKEKEPEDEAANAKQLDELALLQKYIKNEKVEQVARRNILLGIKLENEFAAQSTPNADSSPNEHQTNKRKVRPQNIVRMYEKVLQNIREQIETLEDANMQVPASLTAQQTQFQAHRCFYVATTYVDQSKWAEALVLQEKALDLAQQAMEDYQSVPQELKAINSRSLNLLLTRIRAAKCLALARAFLLRVDSSKGPGERADVENEDQNSADDLTSLVATNVDQAQPFPPEMNPIPCRDIFLDLAYNHIQPPDLSHRTDKSGKKGQQGGWLSAAKGWFGN